MSHGRPLPTICRPSARELRAPSGRRAVSPVGLMHACIARQFTQAFERLDLIVASSSLVSTFPWTELHAGKVDGQALRNDDQWLALTDFHAASCAGAQPAGTGLAAPQQHGGGGGWQRRGNERPRGSGAQLGRSPISAHTLSGAEGT